MLPGTVFDFDLDEYATARRALIEQRLQEYLPAGEPQSLSESMRYSVLSGGKRVRALLCLASAEAAAQDSARAMELALPCACAIEMVHAMSLIHDDLPCMDNDDFRRGKPTNHKVFGEAMALLAGDALLVYASETLIRHSDELIDPRILLDVVASMNNALGAEGMVGGQVADSIATGLISSAKSELPCGGTELLESIHKRKTGALLRFSTWSGARLMNADEHVLKQLAHFGEVLGLAFQIADDLLDVTGDIATLGKTPGKDEASGKLTWVSIYGIEESKSALEKLEAEGKSLLRQTKLPETKLAPLAALLQYAIHRTN